MPAFTHHQHPFHPVTTFTYRYLDPADRLVYQEELLRQLEVRNESLSTRMGQERADARYGLNATIGSLGGLTQSHLQRAMAGEFHQAGQELLDLISRARKELKP